MLIFRYHIKDVSKVIFIMIFVIWYLIESILFSSNINYGLNKNEIHKQFIKKNVDNAQIELVFTKNETKETISSYSSVDKQKNKFSVTRGQYKEALSLLILYQENHEFLSPLIDGRDGHLRSPPDNLS
jgi:hypothetical protein